jgi:4-alpha-glucanotransferase
MQDLMSLGNEARMNFPGKTGGWWTWRYRPEMLTGEIAHRLNEITELFGRIYQPGAEDQGPRYEIDVEEADG